MLSFQSQSFTFTPADGATPKKTQTFSFDNTIRNYGAALQGFEFKFGADEDDNNIETMTADITNISLNNNKTEVTVEVEFTFKDHRDHIGEGQVDVVVFADLET